MARGKKNGGKKKKSPGGMRRIRGRGDYQVSAGGAGGGGRSGIFAKLDRALSRIPRGSFAKAGAAVGNRYGGGIGAKVGALAGAGLSAISGYGDYKVKMNSLSRMSASVDMIPQFVKNDHSVRVTHREFIRDVAVPTSAAPFDLKSYLINPANRDLFPWLANMAKQYSQYKIHGMVFVFKTMSSDYSQAGPLGTIMMATNYNAVDRDFTNKLELENTEFAVSCKPSTSLIHAIECDPKYSGMDVLYVRDPSYETTDTSDKRFYDFGKFQIATQGLPGAPNSTMGELWVSYDIELMKPIIGGGTVTGVSVISKSDGSVGVSATSDYQFVSLSGAPINPVAGSVQNLLFAGGDPVGSTGMIGPVFTSNASGVTFKRNGRFTLTLSGTAATGATSFVYPTGDSATFITWTTAAFGNASAAIITSAASAVQGNNIAFAGPTSTTANGYNYRVTIEVYVTGISSSADTVTLTPSSFNATSVNLITGLLRRISVGWIALATNDQSQAYLPKV